MGGNISQCDPAIKGIANGRQPPNREVRMALTTLKPRLQAIDTRKVTTLDAKAGSTAMPGGRRWMATRERVALAHGYQCAECGLAWRTHIDQIDHCIPREQGGSNDDSNLRPMCRTCHKAKTDKEAATRAGR